MVGFVSTWVVGIVGWKRRCLSFNGDRFLTVGSGRLVSWWVMVRLGIHDDRGCSRSLHSLTWVRFWTGSCVEGCYQLGAPTAGSVAFGLRWAVLGRSSVAVVMVGWQGAVVLVWLMGFVLVFFFLALIYSSPFLLVLNSRVL